MTAISINLPDSTTSKAEEIAILEKLVSKMATTSSYLSSLFSRGLLEWASWNIKQDYSCDIVDALNIARREKDAVIDQASADLNRKARQIKDLEQQVSQLETSLKNAQADCSRYLETMGELEQAKYSLQDHLGAAQRQLAEAEDEHRLDVERLEMQVIRLKARIYDLQNPGQSDQENIVLHPVTK